MLIHQVRSVDTLSRPVTRNGSSVPPVILADVRAKIAALTGID